MTKENNKKLCFTVVTDRAYMDYAPYCVYTVLKSYPEYYVKVYTPNEFEERHNKCFEMIRSWISDRFEIKEKYFLEGYEKAKDKRQYTKSMRFALPEEEFNGFDYGYIADIDILLVRENPTLLEGHIEHCKKIGLPYSNAIRTSIRRLTGLHFFNVKEYYAKMGDVLKKYREDYRLLEGNPDEVVLYDMAEEGIGFGDRSMEQGRENFYRPHHGIHLGLFRVGDGGMCRIKTPDYINDMVFQHIHNAMNNEVVNLFLMLRQWETKQ